MNLGADESLKASGAAPSAGFRPNVFAEAVWPVAVALLSRAVLAGLIFCVRHSVPLNPAYAWATDAFGPDGVVLDGLVRWDAWSYLKIAEKGYLGDGHEAFFPVLPLLLRGVGTMVGGPVVAGVLLSNVAFVVDAVLIYAFARQTLSVVASRRAVVFFVVHPSTIFFSSIYTESIFVLLATSSLLLARRGRIASASALACVATATRMPGVALMPAIALYALDRVRLRGWRLRLGDVGNFLCVALVPLGLVLFAWHLKARVGDAFAFMHAGHLWGRTLAPPWVAFENFFAYRGPIVGFNWSEAVVVVLAIVGAGLSFRRLELPLAVYSAVCLLLPLSSGMLSSAQRYSATVVPLYLVAALVSRRPAVQFALLTVFGTAAVYTSMLFALRYWAG